MSSRNINYEDFLEAWKEISDITNDVETLINEHESLEVAQEFARLLKVITYLDNSIKSMDSDLVPLDLWLDWAQNCRNCKPHIEAVITTQTQDTILQANNYIDVILTKLSPYIQDNISKLNALKPAFNTYIKHINKHLKAYDEKNSVLVQNLEYYRNNSIEINDEISKFKENISKIHTELLTGTDEEPSLQEKLKELENIADTQHAKIKEFYQQLLTNDDSIKSQVDEAQQLILSTNSEIQEIRDDLSEKLNDLDKFHKKIFGEPNEDGSLDDGLKFEIEQRKDELDLLQETQTTQYQALKNNIESLLPGATSAGLASAYHDLSISFDETINKNTNRFFYSIAAIIVISILLTIQEVNFSSLTLVFVDLADMKNIGEFFLLRLPVILPAIWFAAFASKRRSEAERLKQEYAHKEALAKSYQSFKLQIEQLGDEQKEPLLEKLLSAAIDTISENASNTLDKNHGDKLPFIEVIDRTVDRTLNRLSSSRAEE